MVKYIFDQTFLSIAAIVTVLTFGQGIQALIDLRHIPAPIPLVSISEPMHQYTPGAYRIIYDMKHILDNTELQSEKNRIKYEIKSEYGMLDIAALPLDLQLFYKTL